MEVLVFKTSVETPDAVARLKAGLDRLAGEGRWNFALDDCDRILRIKAETTVTEQAISLLRAHGFGCAELND
jgi:hypothetical protein